MEQDKDHFKRIRPAEEGRNNDPFIRDESAQQPGVNTISSSDTDDANQKLTETASDGFVTGSEFGKGADPKFDEVDREEEGEVI